MPHGTPMPFMAPHMPHGAPMPFMAPHMPHGTPMPFMAPNMPHGTPFVFWCPHLPFWLPICLYGTPLPFIWLNAMGSLPFNWFNAMGSLPFNWLHAMGSLPFISASCHGFIAVSFGFIATGSLPSPKSICLLAPPNPFASGTPNLFAYWRPICHLAPQIYLPFWHPGAPFHQMCDYNTYDSRS